MQGMTTVVVVHEAAAPEKKGLVALCDEHTAHLRRATWGRIDELVGFSTVMDCEACALIDHAAPDVHAVATERPERYRHLHPLPNTA